MLEALQEGAVVGEHVDCFRFRLMVFRGGYCRGGGEGGGGVPARLRRRRAGRHCLRTCCRSRVGVKCQGNAERYGESREQRTESSSPNSQGLGGPSAAYPTAHRENIPLMFRRRARRHYTYRNGTP